MQCPVCDSYGKTYASKPLGSVKIRYRCCEGCGHRFRTFEEIDQNPVVRGHVKALRVPVDDPADVRCAHCNSNRIRHERKTSKGETITHFYACKDCDGKFGVEAGLDDPIGKARKAATVPVVVCPVCATRALSRGPKKRPTHTVRRYRCPSCNHRFERVIEGEGADTQPPEILEGEPDHRVMP